MTPLSTYLVRETAISAAINCAITVGFFFAVFHGQAHPAVWGAKGLVVDCLPQGFMVGLMSTVPAMLLTRKRLAAGQVAPLEPMGRPPRRILTRSLVVAPVSMIALTVVAAAAAKATGSASLPFGPALALKLAASAIISIIVTPGAICAALAPKG